MVVWWWLLNCGGGDGRVVVCDDGIKLLLKQCDEGGEKEEMEEGLVLGQMCLWMEGGRGIRRMMSIWW